MWVVRTFTGAFQADGNGGWQTIGNTEPMTIPENGYLAVYLSNASDFSGCSHCLASEGDVYFDHLEITFTHGHLQEENGYYPYGLPMAGQSSTALGMTPNRQKYQSNEYITEAGLNWMSFGARQYDPQLGRFLSVDPLAAAGGQESNSPYEAMGDEPASGTDPGGMQPQPGWTIGMPPPLSNSGSYSFFFPSSASLAASDEGSVFNKNPGLDPLGISEWMDATAQEESREGFWDGVNDALNKLMPGQDQNIYNDGNGNFSYGLVYNLGASNSLALNNPTMLTVDNEKIESPNSGSSGDYYSSTYTRISNFSDNLGEVTAFSSTTVEIVNTSRYGAMPVMNYIGGISKGVGYSADGLTVALDLAGVAQTVTKGRLLPSYIKPMPYGEAATDGAFIIIGEVGDIPGIVISGIYFVIARPLIFGDPIGNFSNCNCLSVPNVDNARVYIPPIQ